MTQLGEVLRLRREHLGMSQQALARALGVGQQSISRWEKGDGIPRPPRIAKLAEVLDMDADYLHRAAGFLPQEERSAMWSAFSDLYAHIGELTDQELWLLTDRCWQELRQRRGYSAFHRLGDD